MYYGYTFCTTFQIFMGVKSLFTENLHFCIFKFGRMVKTQATTTDVWHHQFLKMPIWMWLSANIASSLLLLCFLTHSHFGSPSTLTTLFLFHESLTCLSLFIAIQEERWVSAVWCGGELWCDHKTCQDKYVDTFTLQMRESVLMFTLPLWFMTKTFRDYH